MSTPNPKVYIHEYIDIIGHHRAAYMHHMTANWSPIGQELRDQQCFGVWATIGTTGRWPQVVNLWQEDGFDGLASSFAIEAVGRGAQDPALEKWWAKAADFRSGGVDRVLRPAPWSPTIESLCADGVRGECYVHEQITVEPGAADDLLDLVLEHGIEARAAFGLDLVGAFATTMRNDHECIVLWAAPTWAQWGRFEDEQRSHPASRAWSDRTRGVIRDQERIVLVDAPLSPMRIGRQPNRGDRTDYVD